MTGLTVVIPARNEAGRIGPAIRTVHALLEDARIEHRILVVDDASEDETGAEARALQSDHPVDVLRHDVAQGKGAAVATGFRASDGAFCAFIDADLEFPPEALVEMWQALHRRQRPGAACAVGERRVDERTFMERLSSHAAQAAIRMLTRLPVHDTQAGVKMFPGWFARDVLGTVSERGWLFDVEALLRARSSGLAILPVAVRQQRLRPRRASLAEFLRCGPVLLRLAWASSRASFETAAARDADETV